MAIEHLRRRYLDSKQPNSLTTRMRRQRFSLFRRLVANLTKPIRILDVGGESIFWAMMGKDSDWDVTVLNVCLPPVPFPGCTEVLGDACNMPEFARDDFDVVFSNAVLEHLRTWDNQKRAAAEMRRVGRRYFVQTPSRFFPLDPHTALPILHLLPVNWQIEFMARVPTPVSPHPPSHEFLRKQRGDIRLITLPEMRTLFPDGRIFNETICGLTKSFTAYGGWDMAPRSAKT